MSSGRGPFETVGLEIERDQELALRHTFRTLHAMVFTSDGLPPKRGHVLGLWGLTRTGLTRIKQRSTKFNGSDVEKRGTFTGANPSSTQLYTNRSPYFGGCSALLMLSVSSWATWAVVGWVQGRHLTGACRTE